MTLIWTIIILTWLWTLWRTSTKLCAVVLAMEAYKGNYEWDFPFTKVQTRIVDIAPKPEQEKTVRDILESIGTAMSALFVFVLSLIPFVNINLMTWIAKTTIEDTAIEVKDIPPRHFELIQKPFGVALMLRSDIDGRGLRNLRDHGSDDRNVYLHPQKTLDHFDILSQSIHHKLQQLLDTKIK